MPSHQDNNEHPAPAAGMAGAEASIQTDSKNRKGPGGKTAQKSGDNRKKGGLSQEEKKNRARQLSQARKVKKTILRLVAVSLETNKKGLERIARMKMRLAEIEGRLTNVPERDEEAEKDLKKAILEVEEIEKDAVHTQDELLKQRERARRL